MESAGFSIPSNRPFHIAYVCQFTEICNSLKLKALSGLLLLCISLFLPIAAQSAFYQTAMVHSVYLDHSSGIWQKSTDWVFQNEGPGRISISEHLGSPPVVLLTHDETGKVTTITKHLRRGAQDIEIEESASGPIILSDGFPVPYDQLSPFTEISEQLSLKNSVGGVTFTSSASRTVVPISPEDALAAGMLTPDSAGTSSPEDLTLISVIKFGQPVIRQLWKAGEPFWLYEETPNRKSWRTSLTVVP